MAGKVSKEKRPPAAAKGGVKPKAMKLGQAREAAVAGQIDLALPVLEAHAAKGAASAWAALAQIRAYRGDWTGALDAAARLLADPNDIYAGNVIDDAKWLVLRAAHETGRWKDAAEAILSAKPLGPRTKDPVGDFIKKQAKAAGKLVDPPYARVDEDRAKLSPAQRQTKYDEWMRRFDDEKKKRKPGERESAVFSYAHAYGLDELAMKTWPAVESQKLWHHVAEAARLFARNGRDDAAWTILERKIRHFWPVDVGQVAPVEPVVDEVLRKLMTPARLAALLATPKAQDL